MAKNRETAKVSSFKVCNMPIEKLIIMQINKPIIYAVICTLGLKIWFLLHVSPTSLILETYYGDFISRVRLRFRYKVISIILVS